MQGEAAFVAERSGSVPAFETWQTRPGEGILLHLHLVGCGQELDLVVLSGNGGEMMKLRILEIPFMSQASLLELQKRILKIISQERERLLIAAL